MSAQNYFRLVIFTGLLAIFVVGLGALTRLADAGLGCPDWPGCYGELLVPKSEELVKEKHYLEQRPLEQPKAWKEMIHRYFAGTLGILILVIAIASIMRRKEKDQPFWHPQFLLALVVFQAALGMWTVTLQLKPIVVMGHLMGGFTTLALLFLLALRSSPNRLFITQRTVSQLVGMIALLMVIVQIALGGWTAANYAAVACPDFPTCQGVWWPETDFNEGFVLWRGLGVNYEFGVLEHPARVAIHLTHRIGAVITFLFVGWMAWRLIAGNEQKLARTGWLIIMLLITQISLGIANVVLALPLEVAVAHNLVGSLLLLSLVLLNFQLWRLRQ